LTIQFRTSAVQAEEDLRRHMVMGGVREIHPSRSHIVSYLTGGLIRPKSDNFIELGESEETADFETRRV